jgi:hypothetical protein
MIMRMRSIMIYALFSSITPFNSKIQICQARNEFHILNSKDRNMQNPQYPSAIKRKVTGDWNCPHCNNLNFSFRN